MLQRGIDKPQRVAIVCGMTTCSILQQRDRGRPTDCGRPAKYVARDGTPFCGIHARRSPWAMLPASDPVAIAYLTHRHNPFIEGEWCGPRIRFVAAVDESER